jgi:hypothetical protein
MSWGMFQSAAPNYYRIKILIETNSNDIFTYYLEELEIQKIIPELKLSISSQSTLLNNYLEFSDFMNDFLIQRFSEIFKNIKYLQIYRLVYNSKIVRTCTNFDHDQSRLILSHEYK